MSCTKSVYKTVKVTTIYILEYDEIFDSAVLNIHLEKFKRNCQGTGLWVSDTWIDGLNVFRYLRVNCRYWSVCLVKVDSNMIEGTEVYFVCQKYLEKSPLNNYGNRCLPEVRNTFCNQGWRRGLTWKHPCWVYFCRPSHVTQNQSVGQITYLHPN